MVDRLLPLWAAGVWRDEFLQDTFRCRMVGTGPPLWGALAERGGPSPNTKTNCVISRCGINTWMNMHM